MIITMSQIVSITSQGQLTVPKALREALGINGATKAEITRQGNTLIVKPKNDFWSLAGSLSSEVELSDDELKQARQEFSKQWSNEK